MECISAAGEYISSTIVKQTRSAIEEDKERKKKKRKSNSEQLRSTQMPPREPRALIAYGQNDLPERTTIAFSETGLATPRILEGWAKKFNKESFEKSAEFQQYNLTMDEWFHPQEGYHSHSEKTAEERSGIKPIYRLLVVDNYYSHWELPFVEYLHEYDIKVMALPSHMTHLMQPLDVSVFSSLKRGHQRTIATQVRYEKHNYGFTDFLDHFNSFHSQSFERKALLLSGWRESGLYPCDSEQVTVRMDTMHAEKLNEPQLPERTGLSGAENGARWWDQDATDAAKGLGHVSTKYGALLSSPSRKLLKQAEVVANQSLLISHELDKHEAGKLKALRQQKKSRRQVVTKGGMIDVEELRREEAKRNAEDEAEMQRRQMAIVERQAKAEQRERRKAFMKEIAAYKKEKGRRNHKLVVFKGLNTFNLQSILNGGTIQTRGTVENGADFVPFDSDCSLGMFEDDDISIIVDRNSDLADSQNSQNSQNPQEPQDPQDLAGFSGAFNEPSGLFFGHTCTSDTDDSDECIPMSELSDT